MSGDPVAVVSPDFCVPYPVDFTVVRKVPVIGHGKYEVKDVNGNLMFRVEEALLSFQSKRVIIDASGTPIVTLRRKILTAHSRWRAFRGESADEEDKLFEAKTSSLFQLSTKLHVFLVNNTSNEEVPDYAVKGAWTGRSCEIYSGNSTILLAKMEKKFKFFGNDKLLVTMYPKVDSAFIVSLIVIFDEIKRENERAAANTHHSHHHTSSSCSSAS